ncbi:hypothetical protein QWM81_13730 [Streptomyces ficellus]|uniref:Uncharacterized protein n=1 Tax=Streptomyces ficellus TaxID=1977088 RepID=A0ABT7Z6I3_9ACTN|nr:hypothetical protein [Streptomyces ficellus]MDN3295095.1 hypothetical protein [Streptomyces ficellus]
MAVFGLLATALGAVGLAAPDALLTLMGFAPVPDARRADGDHTLVFLTASSMAAVNMGVYYMLAALADWRAFFRWTVPFRLLTCAVFTLTVLLGRAPSGFLAVGLWEALGAAATGAALRHEQRSRCACKASPVRRDFDDTT